MYPYLGLLSVLLLNVVHGVNGDNNDGSPDFSSFQYSGQPSERSFQPSYDFCVVGGGAAGLVLGNRLCESGKHTVIVFEAGGPPTVMRTYAPPGGLQFGLYGRPNEKPFRLYCGLSS
jgi:choline dehydrogenase